MQLCFDIGGNGGSRSLSVTIYLFNIWSTLARTPTKESGSMFT